MVVTFVLMLTAVVGVTCWVMNAYFAQDLYGCYGADGYPHEVCVVRCGIMVEKMCVARAEYSPSAPHDIDTDSVC